MLSSVNHYKQLFFLPPMADFLNGQRPLFFTMAFCVYIISLLNPNQPNDRFVFIHPAFYPFKEKPFVQIITNGFYLHIGSSFQFPIKPSL